MIFLRILILTFSDRVMCYSVSIQIIWSHRIVCPNCMFRYSLKVPWTRVTMPSVNVAWHLWTLDINTSRDTESQVLTHSPNLQLLVFLSCERESVCVELHLWERALVREKEKCVWACVCEREWKRERERIFLFVNMRFFL